jgi:hypothetical protein
MKKNIVVIIAVSIIVLVLIVLLMLNRTVLKRTPESILEATFGISLKNFDCSVEIFEEQWYPNGDGHVFIVYKLNKLTQENMDCLKSFSLNPLPILEEGCNFNEILEKYINLNTGYYTYQSTSADGEPQNCWSYNIFVVDTEKKIAVLYCQYM